MLHGTVFHLFFARPVSVCSCILECYSETDLQRSLPAILVILS